MKKYIKNLHITHKSFINSIFLMLLMMVTINMLKAQLITIGTQTTQTGTTTASPYNSFWESRRLQYVYTAAEINAAIIAAGGTTGQPRVITSIAWDIAAVISNHTLANYTIKLANGVSNNTTGTFTNAGLVTVKNAFNLAPGNPAAPGFFTINFDNNFTWDGTSSLIVDVCWGVNTSWSPSQGQVWMYSGTGNVGIDVFSGSANQCAALTGTTGTIKPRIRLNTALPLPCTGTPATANVTVSNPCANPVSFSSSGVTPAIGLTYEWQYSAVSPTTGFTPIAGQTNPNMNLAGASSGWYRLVVTCTASGNSSISNAVQLSGPSYFPVTTSNPFTEDFENNWINSCNPLDIPPHASGNIYWKQNFASNQTSWRRPQQANPAFWTTGWTGTMGIPTPEPGVGGTGIACFNSAWGTNTNVASLDLYLNLSTATAHRLEFKFVNNHGVDGLRVRLSTDGGNTFQLIDTLGRTSPNPLGYWIGGGNLPPGMPAEQSTTSYPSWSSLGYPGVTAGGANPGQLPVWIPVSMILPNGVNATNCVLRFEGYADFGWTSMAIDNIVINPLLDCTQLPTPVNGGTTTATVVNGCAPISTKLSVTNSSDTNYAGFSYQWQISTDGGVTFTDIAGANGRTYDVAGITSNTRFRRIMVCTVTGGSGVSSVLEIKVKAPIFANLPFTENFEPSWVNQCATKDVPEGTPTDVYWRNTPVSGNASWRRHDEGATAGWGGTAAGRAQPDPVNGGTGCANFNSDAANSGTVGNFDLFLNLGTSTVHQVKFLYANNGGTDRLRVFLSNDGGVNFDTNPLIDLGFTPTLANASGYGPTNQPVWKEYTINLDNATLSTPTTSTSVLRFSAISDFGNNNIGLDNVTVVPVFAQDVGVSKVRLVRCSPRFANVEVEVTNFGYQEASNFPISYTLNAGTPVTEVYTQAIAPFAKATYLFSVPVDLTNFGTSINIAATTQLLGDGNPNNDALTQAVAVPPLGGSGNSIIPPYTENFNSVSAGQLPAGWTKSQQPSSNGWILSVPNPPNTTANNRFPFAPANFSNSINGGTADGSNFMATDDNRNNGNTISNVRDATLDFLVTPAFNLTGFTSATISFDAYFERFASGPTFTLKGSIDNGSTWVAIPGGSITPGTWTNYVVTLPATYLNRPSVLFAFHYDDANRWGEGAAVDNFSITGTSPQPPVVQANFATSVVPDRYVERNTISHPIYKMSMIADPSSDVTLSDFLVTTAGTYQSNDIVPNSFKLWYSVDTTLNAGDELLATRAFVNTGGKLVFNCINKVVKKGETAHFIISVDIAAAATIGRTIQILTPVLNNTITPAESDVILLTGTKLGILGSGGVQTIVGFNNPPTSANFTISTRTNIPYSFQVGDFPFADLDAPDIYNGQFREILIQTVDMPNNSATLTLNNVPITPNPTNLRIRVSDIPNLKFTPAPGDTRTNYATFTFKVYDGRAFSTNSYTASIDILGDNLFFPAVFTPGTNDLNGTFRIVGGGISRVEKFNFKIFDRNNNLLYETNDIVKMNTLGWDGKNKDGVLLPTGTYLWSVEGKYTDGKDLKVNDKTSGVIRLIR